MNKGFGLIEIVFGSAIVALSMFGIFSVAAHSLRISRHALDEVKAGYLLEEGAEAVRSIRDRSFSDLSSLATSTAYYLNWTGGAGSRFATTSVTTYVDGAFERSFQLFSVYRDGSDRIAASGTLDTGTRRVKISVSWRGINATTTKTLEFYLADI